MTLKGIRVGFALTGSHCTFAETFPEIEKIAQQGAEIYPIISEAVKTTNTRFGKSSQWIERMTKITGREPIYTIPGAEPVGPEKLLDILVIAPCTGNTLAKLSHGITDGPVLMATKAHLRNLRPVVMAISTNDGLGVNARNLGSLINAKNIFIVPFGQDSPKGKPNSLKSDGKLILATIEAALLGKQLQPMIISLNQ